MPIQQLHGVDVDFPYEPYDCQLALMAKVIEALKLGNNALLESPTGTGKTLCMLCATLAWRNWLKTNQGNIDALGVHSAALVAAGQGQAPAGPAPGAGLGPPQGLPLIIYSSRTHSQLAQVIKELRNTTYRVKSSVLASRQQMCQHTTVSKMPAGPGNLACRALVSHRECSWHNRGRLEKTTSEMLNTELHPAPDIEELIKVGRAQGACPFYVSRDMMGEADIIFMPYNYLLDMRTRKTIENIRWENSVVIFDEAHNVENVCSDSYSFDLTATQVALCLSQLRAARELCLERVASGEGSVETWGSDGATAVDARQLAEDLQVCCSVVKAFETEVANLPIDRNSGFTAPGEKLMELLAAAGLTAETADMFMQRLNAAAQLLSDKEMEGGKRLAGRQGNLNAGVSAVLEALQVAFNALKPLLKGGPPAVRGYRLYVHMERQASNSKLTEAPTVSFWCFVPGVAMHALQATGVRSFLLTSGTLSPLESFISEMQMPFPCTLENPHIIQPSQVWVGVVPTGPTGVTLTSTYSCRDDPRYKEDLGNAVVNLARMVPDGLLVFFPSYTVMTGCLDFWRSAAQAGGATIWERICRFKQPVLEPRDAAHFQAAIDDFRAKLDDPSSSGAVFFAVCRGKVSEGLDFADRAGRAVVITGIPYAMKTDPKVRIKQEVLDEANRAGGPGIGRGLSGSQWYGQSASRAVNQAIGRVIRHRYDYGAVILCDARFANAGTQRQLSRWMRDYVQSFPNFGASLASLGQFFKDKAGFKAPDSYRPAASAGAAGAQAGGANAFAVVATRAGASKAGAAKAGSATLLDRSLIPAAFDVSGLGALSNQEAAAIAAKAAAAEAAGAGSTAAEGRAGLMGALGAGGSKAGGGRSRRRRSEELMNSVLGMVGDGKHGSGAAQGSGKAGSAGGGSASLLPPSSQQQQQLALARAAGAPASSGSQGAARAGPVGRMLPLQPRQHGGAPPRVAGISSTRGGRDGDVSALIDSLTKDGAGAGQAKAQGPKKTLDQLIAERNAQQAQQRGKQQGRQQPQGSGGSVPQPQHSDGAGMFQTTAAAAPERLTILQALSNSRLSGSRRSDSKKQASGASSGGGQTGSHRVSGAVAAGTGAASGRDVDDSSATSKATPEAAAAAAAAKAVAAEGAGAGSRLQRSSGPGAASAPAAAGAAAAAQVAEAASAPAGQQGGQGGQAGGSSSSGHDFMRSLKEQLPGPTLAKISLLLKAYKQSRDVAAFMEGIIAALKAPDTAHLLLGFVDRVPAKEREWFSRVVMTHQVQGTSRPAGGQGQQQDGKGAAGGSRQVGSTAGAAGAASGPGSVARPAGSSAQQQAQQIKSGQVTQQQAKQQQAQQQAKQQDNSIDGFLKRIRSSAAAAAATAAAKPPTGAYGSSRQPLQQQQQQQQQQQPGSSRPGSTARAVPSALRPPTGAPAAAAAAAAAVPAGQSAAAGPGAAGRPVQRAVHPPVAAPAGPSGKRPVGTQQQQRAGQAQEQDKRPRCECVVCGKAAEKVYVPSCNHTGCYSCWVRVMTSTRTCPKCSRAVKRHNDVRPLHFCG